MIGASLNQCRITAIPLGAGGMGGCADIARNPTAFTPCETF